MKFTLYITNGPRGGKLVHRGYNQTPWTFTWNAERKRHELILDSLEDFHKADPLIRNAIQHWPIYTEITVTPPPTKTVTDKGLKTK